MTYTRVILLQLVLYFCVTSCTVYYRSNIQNYDYGRRHWNHYIEYSNIATTETSKNTRNEVMITLYYEALCPASTQYLKDILRPVVERLGQYLNIHLVPYGHAETLIINKKYKFNCQHGRPECYGNKLHGCAIDTIQNNTKSTLFVACLMEHTEYKAGIGVDYLSALFKCAQVMNVSSDSIRRCVASRRGVLLLKRFGDETYRLPKLEYVPYALINGIETPRNENLVTLICRQLYPVPIACQPTEGRRTSYVYRETSREKHLTF